MYTLFGPKTAFFWPRGPHFDPKPQKHSVPSCYNPKQSIPGPKLVSERLCHFWVLQAPQNLPRPPQTPPMVQGGQKWPKFTCTSPVLIIRKYENNLRGKIFRPIFPLRIYQQKYGHIFPCACCHTWKSRDQVVELNPQQEDKIEGKAQEYHQTLQVNILIYIYI